MNKIQKFIKGLQLLIKNPSLINLVINSEYRWSDYLKRQHSNSLQLPVIDIEDILNSTNKVLNNFTFLGGGSLATDILLLKALANKISNCSYFEIGTWRGESVINVAEIAKECYTLNLSREKIISQGLSEKYADLHGVLSKKEEKINHLFGDSLKFDFESLGKKFDLIFIDGSHQYKYVKNDTQKVFSHLTHKNSIVVWHDYAYTPESVRSEVLAGIYDGIPNKFKHNLYHVSNTLCAIYYPKEIKSTLIEFPINPTKKFEVKIEIKKINI